MVWMDFGQTRNAPISSLPGVACQAGNQFLLSESQGDIDPCLCLFPQRQVLRGPSGESLPDSTSAKGLILWPLAQGLCVCIADSSQVFVCHYFKKNKTRTLKPISDFADRVSDIIWRLEDFFFVKKKLHVNPGMREAEKYVNG